MLLAYKASLLVVVVESAFARQSDSVYVQYGAATCQRGVVNKFLKVPLAYLGNLAAEVQPNGLGN